MTKGMNNLIEELDDEQLAACVGGCDLQLGVQLLGTNQSAEIPLGELTGQTTSDLGIGVVSTSIPSSLIGASVSYNSDGSKRYLSDHAIKESFEEVNVQQVLEKVAALPITTWKYTDDPNSVRHLGPMAQDFAAAFGLGDSDRSIQIVDANGVTFAAIQGLYQMLIQKSAEIAVLHQELTSLKQRLS